jgi:hypothetical protein
MWEMRTLMFFASGVEKLAGRAKWYPTSREKRARYGAPIGHWHEEIPKQIPFHAPVIGNAGGRLISIFLRG